MLSNWFWKKLTIAVVRKSNIILKPYPPTDIDSVRPIPIHRRWSGLDGNPLMISEITPRSERTSAAAQLILKTVLGLKEHIGLTKSYRQPFRSTRDPYPVEYLKIHPASEVPEDFAPDADWAAGIAWRGPFSILTRKTDTGFEIDMSAMEQLPVRQGLLRAGGKASFVPDGNKLKTVTIEQGGKVHTPASADWLTVKKRFLTGTASHTTVIEHLIYCHMVVGGSFALSTYETLPSRHPLRLMLQPFIIETMRVNNDNIDGLIKSEQSNVPSYTGHPLKTINEIINKVSASFDIQLMDPEWRARTQGTLDAGLVTVQSRVELFRIFREMTSRYAREVLVTPDPETIAWVQTLDRYIPNGVMKLLGIGQWSELTLEHVAYVAALVAFTVSVTHHVVADTVRDYMMQFQIMPPALGEDGFPKTGMVLEKMNSITIAGVLRYRLVDTTALTPPGAATTVWSDFQAALQAYQAKVDAAGPDQQRYLIHPNQIPSSIHA